MVLSTYPGSFRLPNEVKLWLLREEEAIHLFQSMPVEDSNFAKSAVFDSIEDPEVSHSGVYDDTWAHFNSSIVHRKEEAFYGTGFAIETKGGRTDESLVKAVEKFEPNDFRIVEADGEGFEVRNGRNGEYIVNQNQRNT